jgi:hypothetical protein
VGTLPPHAVARRHFCSNLRDAPVLPQMLIACPPRASAESLPQPARTARPWPACATLPPPARTTARPLPTPAATRPRPAHATWTPVLPRRAAGVCPCPTTGPPTSRSTAGSLTPSHQSSCSPTWLAPPHRCLLCSRRLSELLHASAVLPPQSRSGQADVPSPPCHDLCHIGLWLSPAPP